MQRETIMNKWRHRIMTEAEGRTQNAVDTGLIYCSCTCHIFPLSAHGIMRLHQSNQTYSDMAEVIKDCHITKYFAFMVELILDRIEEYSMEKY